MRPRTVPAVLAVFSIMMLYAALARAQDPGKSARLGENAALRYWTAFAVMPKLDAQQQKLLSAQPGAEVDAAAAAKLIEDGRNALLYLRRGAAIGPCDWGLPRGDGPYLLLPHLAKARDLGRLASLRARQEMAEGKGAAAVDDAADAMVLARHASSDLTAIISYLVQLAIERNVIEGLAPQLASVDPAALEQLDRRLAALPPGGSLEQCMRVERDSFLEWAVKNLREMNDQDPWKERVLGPFSADESQAERDKLEKVVAACGGTREGVLRQFEAMRPLYEEMGRILRLPREEFRTKFAALQARAKDNPVAVEVLPSMTKVYDRDAAGRTRFTMLRAAVAVVRGGPEKAKDFKDAAGNPLTYAASPDGFELRSTVTDEDQPVKLTVGGAKKST